MYRRCTHNVNVLSHYSDRQNIEIKLLDVKKGECIATAPVPLNAPRATLQWLGFSEMVPLTSTGNGRLGVRWGVVVLTKDPLVSLAPRKQGTLLVRDSVGQVCGLFNSFGWSFVPVFNFAELNEAGNHRQSLPYLHHLPTGIPDLGPRYPHDYEQPGRSPTPSPSSIGSSG